MTNNQQVRLDPQQQTGINFTIKSGKDFFQMYLSRAKLNGSLIFNKKGDLAQPKYAVYQYQHDIIKNEAMYRKIGTWFDRRLSFQMEKLKWN